MLTPSPDLIALARSQMGILAQTLGIAMGAVYLAEEVAGAPPQLQQILTYPEQGNMLPPMTHLVASSLLYQGMMVLPLLYENTLLGVLTLDRGGGEWTEKELAIVQQVVQTLTIAVALEQRNYQLYRQQQDFLARLLHQLRNPLTAIRTFAQLLWRRLGGDSRNQPLAEQILTEVSHLQELLNLAEFPQPALLGGSAPVKLLPAADLPLTAVDIVPILHQVARNGEAIAQERGLTFALALPDHVPTVQANPEALREILSNLVDNAIKYTPQGSITITVTPTPTAVLITVKDTGVGIPPTDMDKIFMPQVRGTSAVGEGKGLGLAIVADLVREMGGTITVTSEVGQGSEFTLSLPLVHP